MFRDRRKGLLAKIEEGDPVVIRITGISGTCVYRYATCTRVTTGGRMTVGDSKYHPDGGKVGERGIDRWEVVSRVKDAGGDHWVAYVEHLRSIDRRKIDLLVGDLIEWSRENREEGRLLNKLQFLKAELNV